MKSTFLSSVARKALLAGAIAGLVCTAASPAQAQATSTSTASAVRTNPGFNANPIARNDDGSSALFPLGFTINLFGKIRTSAYVNNNGNLTFDSALSTFTPFGLKKTAREIIAPFFADVDTRPTGSKQVFFGTDTVNGHRAFGANYIDVGYYSEHVDKTNSFQVVLIEREDQHPGDFDIEFNYQRISWETGDASGGVNGFGGTPATAGWSNGTDTSYELPGSLIPGAFLDGGPYSLVRQSITGAPVATATTPQGSSGRLIFRARDGVIGPGVSISGGQFSNATVGVPYSAALSVQGATPPYVWTFQSDVVDPPGLSLSSSGVLSGTPTTAGTYSFTLGVTANSEDGPITVYQRGSLTVQPPALSITTGCPLNDGYVGSPYSLNFKASGLASGLLWSLGNTANLPPGVAFNSSGLLAGTPQQPGTFILDVHVTGSANGTIPAQVQCRINVNPAGVLLTQGCYPRATVGVPFTQTLLATGGTGGLRYDLLGQLPLGLALTSDGVIAGTPLTYGVWLFQISATDSVGARQLSTCNMIVDPAHFTTSVCPLPPATTGLPYGAVLGAGYTWSVVGTLPAGLKLDPAGLITGTPMTATAAQFRLIATNAAGQQSGEACSLSVVRGDLAVNGCPLPDGRLGEPYAASLTGAGGSGFATLLISYLGQLPPGLLLNVSGMLSGTPTSAGTYSFTAKVKETASQVSSGGQALQACSLTIQAPQLRITSSCPLPNGRAGEGYSYKLQATGGSTPYRFSYGLLPDGLTGAADGTISGTPKTTGGRSFGLQVTDAASNTADTVCSLAVDAPNVPQISLSDLPASVSAGTTNLSIGIQLASAYTAPVTGVVTISAVPNTLSDDAVANSVDPHLAFANGQTSAFFTIPAGSTHVNVPVVSTGTVAATVTVGLQNLAASGVAIPQFPGLKVFTIAAAAPQITSACYVRTDNDNGIHLDFRINGLTTTRELTHADFTIPGTARTLVLPPVPAQFLIQNTDVISLDVSGLAQDYFSSPLNIRNGGAFALVAPMDLTLAPNSKLPQITLSLFNQIGGSAPTTVPACQ